MTVSNAPRRRARRAPALAAALLAVLCSLALAPGAGAATLPDGRAYELVTRYEEGGREVGINGAEAIYGFPSVNGEAFDWESEGNCCGATSGAAELYQSDRTPNGWQTKAVNPDPGEALGGSILTGLIEEQWPLFWSPDLNNTIFETPASYAAGDERPRHTDTKDLYLEGPTGSLKWLSQGPSGAGTAPDTAIFEGATPNGEEAAFNSAEQLTPNATGLDTEYQQRYLYVRDTENETTRLVDVNNDGSLLGEHGAILGDGTGVTGGLYPIASNGSTTHAISADGSKIFFETPWEAVGAETGELPSHLYMRDLADETTTALDDPSFTGSARYEGASADGSLVFFSSDEGLDGASTAKELYEFNTTSRQIGLAPPMTAVPVSSGEYVGTSAVANDGSRVFFVDDSVLASNTNSVGRAAITGAPNMYVYDTGTGKITFITTLPLGDVSQCEPACATTDPGGLVGEPDVERLAYPTPDGSVFVFESSGDLTNQNQSAETTLTAATPLGHGEDETTITVASTAGFMAGQRISIGSGEKIETAEIETIESPTEMKLAWTQGFLRLQPHEAGETVAAPTLQVYRYSTSDSSLVCISCIPAGVISTSDALMGLGGGGSYAPDGETVPLSENGSRIFFESAYPLLPGVQALPPSPSLRLGNVYEWESGALSLISNGTTAEFLLDGTTPSGNDVFMMTRAQLTSAETDGERVVYDARVGGGFPEQAAPAPCAAQDCRAPVPATEFSVPASATLRGLGRGPVAPGATTPTLRVAKISAAQRSELARTGRITLVVTAAAGKIVGEALAKLHGRMQRVAHGSVTLAHAGTAALTLSLNRAAMSALAKSGSLALQLQISSSGAATVELAKLELASDKYATRARS
jgi:hypothetical protein